MLFQSLTKLASFTADCEIFEITLSRGYNETSFREDLKILYNKLGIENKKVVFLFTDQHVAEEGKKHLRVDCIFIDSSFTACDQLHLAF